MYTNTREYTIDIRCSFRYLFKNKIFTSVNREASMTSLVGSRMIEVVNANFMADKESIFGDVNHDYVKREEEWYKSMSLNVNDIPGGAPEVWKAVASPDGRINSNYGWCVWSEENNSQFDKVINELKAHPESRRAIIIYTRPSMWNDYNEDGRNDFMCTNAVQYLIRNGRVHACVQMRSNDAIFGYKNDRAWQAYMLNNVAKELNLPVGDLFWNVGSLHIYERHFYLVDHFAKTGDTTISKSKYRELYPESEFNK